MSLNGTKQQLSYIVTDSLIPMPLAKLNSLLRTSVALCLCESAPVVGKTLSMYSLRQQLSLSLHCHWSRGPLTVVVLHNVCVGLPAGRSLEAACVLASDCVNAVVAMALLA